MKAAELSITRETTRAPETKGQRVARWIASGVALSLVFSPIVFFVPMAIAMGQCDVQVFSKIERPGGYTISSVVQDCAFIGSNPAEGILAERSRFAWPWPATKEIFFYQPKQQIYSDAVQIYPTGPNTVTVSIKELMHVYLAETNWETLKIEYNIGHIHNPRPTDPITTGEAWAERENALVEHARRQGIRTSVNPAPVPLGNGTSTVPR